MREPYLISQPSGDTEHFTELRTAGTRFREAIERCNPTQLTVWMQNFPNGSCGDATPLLGTYLTKLGHSNFMYVLGERRCHGPNGWHSHAWLEKDGLIIDITADQFPEVTERVIVATHSTWHDTFEREIRHRADLHIYDPATVANLGQAYFAVLAELEH